MPFHLSVSDPLLLHSTPCIVSVLLLSRSMQRGELRSAGIRRYRLGIAVYGPHHCEGPSHGLFLHWRWYEVGALRRFPRAPCSSLAWLLACRCTARCRLRPRVSALHSSLCALTAWPAPTQSGSARSQNSFFSGLVSDQSYTLHLAALAYLPLEFHRRNFTTER